MNICVAMPSRGLVHSRTVDDVLMNTVGRDVCFIFSHGLNIPDSHNFIIEKALQAQPTYIWLVEDDMAIPTGTLDRMIKEIHGHEIVICDYPCGVDQPTVQYLAGEFAYAGLGCVLIDPIIFDKLEAPIFRTDISYQIEDQQLKPYPTRGQPHGLLDVDFWVRIREAGIEPVISKQTVGQYFLRSPELPKTGNHTGALYEVEVWRIP